MTHFALVHWVHISEFMQDDVHFISNLLTGASKDVSFRTDILFLSRKYTENDIRKSFHSSNYILPLLFLSCTRLPRVGNRKIALLLLNLERKTSEGIYFERSNPKITGLLVNLPFCVILQVFFVFYSSEPTCIILVLPTAGAPKSITLTLSTDSGLISMGLRATSWLSLDVASFWRLSKKSRSNSAKHNK